jgi:hypothetical protein
MSGFTPESEKPYTLIPISDARGRLPRAAITASPVGG